MKHQRTRTWESSLDAIFLGLKIEGLVIYAMWLRSAPDERNRPPRRSSSNLKIYDLADAAATGLREPREEEIMRR